ncbi:MAG: acyl-CoA/acyl-ACP dehydrogenase [Dehalococcoidales bacterium]|nr:acyl-CoA/acyl-ACP dehydrogenase [Dehalococcoidales bacterium]
MDFGLNEEQTMLQTSARDFLSNEYSDKILKEMAKDPRGYTPELWNKMAELGWMALSIPEEYGGIGDFIDLILVLQEMGRSGLISPFFSTMGLGASTIIEAGSEDQKQQYLPDIAEGKKVVTLALLETSALFAPEAIKTRAALQGAGYVLDGQKMFVPDANSADCIICAARTRDSGEPGITLFMVDARTPGITCNLLDTISPDKQCELVFKEVNIGKDNILGQVDQGWTYLEKVWDKAAVATCASMVGGMERVLELAVTYAKDRNAFGHPIGAFQSVQHRCADMLIDTDTSRIITYQTAWRLNEGLPSEREAAIAKAWVSQAYRRVVTSAHQVHGAIGFTEDHILHWFTRRARSQEFSFGDVNFHLDKMAALTRK